MRRSILTGTPGSGKTTIIRQLKREGFDVVEEAATDVIAQAQTQGTSEPWQYSSFIDSIADLQRQREASSKAPIQFHDRSVICTAVLADYLGYPRSSILTNELKRIENEAVFQKHVFFIKNLGFVTPTEARQISYEDAVRFEKLHEEVYRKLGFEIVSIEPADLSDRVGAVKRFIK